MLKYAFQHGAFAHTEQQAIKTSKSDKCKTIQKWKATV